MPAAIAKTLAQVMEFSVDCKPGGFDTTTHCNERFQEYRCLEDGGMAFICWEKQIFYKVHFRTSAIGQSAMSRGPLFVHHTASRTTDWELEIVDRDGTPLRSFRGRIAQSFDEYFPLRMTGTMSGVAGPDTHYMALEYCIQANYMKSVTTGTVVLCAATEISTPPDKYINKEYEIAGTLPRPRPRTTDRDRPPDSPLTNRDARPDPNVGAYGLEAISLAGNRGEYVLVQEVPHAPCRAEAHNQRGMPTIVDLGPGSPGGDTSGGPTSPGGGNPGAPTTRPGGDREPGVPRIPVGWPRSWPPWSTRDE